MCGGEVSWRFLSEMPGNKAASLGLLLVNDAAAFVVSFVISPADGTSAANCKEREIRHILVSRNSYRTKLSDLPACATY
jgi:hypothetical protein